MPGVTMQAPPLARGPLAPPPYPPADPQLRSYLGHHIQRRIIAAPVTLVMSVGSILLCWMPPLGLLFGLVVVIMYGFQVRLADYYVAYFQPSDYPDRGLLRLGRILAVIGICLSVVGGVVWLVALLGGR